MCRRLSYDVYHHSLLATTILSVLLQLVQARILFQDHPSITELTTNGANHNNTWHAFSRFLDANKGSQISGISDLKSYFQRFGYLEKSKNFTDIFDDELETTLLRYQKNLGLTQTGKLDQDTINLIMSPRCGMPDDHSSDRNLHTTRRYNYFSGEPRWYSYSSPITLTYAFSNTIDYIENQDIRAVFRSAFSRWSEVIPVNFTETDDYTKAEVKIGWYSRDHGDGEPFDGVLGVLAHAFSPESGRLHLDAAERWAVDLETEKSKVAVDLESVATHEIGHVLGLAHSPVKEAVMYASLRPRTRKVILTRDDVEGVQRLYGTSAGYRYHSKLDQSDMSKACVGRAPTFLYGLVVIMGLMIVLR